MYVIKSKDFILFKENESNQGKYEISNLDMFLVNNF